MLVRVMRFPVYNRPYWNVNQSASCTFCRPILVYNRPYWNVNMVAAGDYQFTVRVYNRPYWNVNKGGIAQVWTA